jgi:hypothetical protein
MTLVLVLVLVLGLAIVIVLDSSQQSRSHRPPKNESENAAFAVDTPQGNKARVGAPAPR